MMSERQHKERVPLGFGYQLWEGDRNPFYLTEPQLLAVYTELLQVEPLRKEQHIMIRTSLPIKHWVWNIFYRTRLCHGWNFD